MRHNSKNEIQTILNQKLKVHHMESLHKVSGLQYETICKAGYRSGQNGWEVDIKDPWTGETQYPITRLDEPKENGQKYEQPFSTKPYPYFSSQLDWTTILDDPSKPIILTEGAKKADSAIQNGFIAVSFQGVWGWSKEKKLIKEMKWVFKEGRVIYLCFDSDLKENENVANALLELGKVAYRHGCQVRQIDLPRKTKGIDDFFLYYGNEAKTKFQELIDKASDPLGNIFKPIDKIFELIDSDTKKFEIDYSALPKTIQEFLAWSTNSTHAPDEFIVNGFIGSCSGALGKSVCIKGPGGKNIYPNLWIACLGKSGAGKTTALNIAVNLLADIHNPIEKEQKAQLKKYKLLLQNYKRDLATEDDFADEPDYPSIKHILLPSITSKEKLYERLAKDYSAGLVAVPEELSMVLADISNDRNGGFKPFLMSLYGGSKVAPSMSFKNSEDLPLIENPAVGILGASTLEAFFRFFKKDDFHSGLLQRFVFPVASMNKPKKAFPPGRDDAKKDYFMSILRGLYEIPETTGQSLVEFELSEEAKSYWENVYEKLDDEFGYISNGAIKCSFERLNNEIIFKVALIFHCLEHSGCLEKYISSDTLKQAISLVNYYKKSLYYVFDQLDKQSVKPIMEKIVNKLKQKFQDGYNYRNLANACRGHNNPLFEESIDRLSELNIIEVKELPNNSNNETKTRKVFLLEKRS